MATGRRNICISLSDNGTNYSIPLVLLNLLINKLNNNKMRRLPVYLLLDTSGSMTGEPIEAVKNGVQVMISSLRQNPQAIETAFISIITFDSTAKQVVPLTDLASFQMVDIKASGTTNLGEALKVVSTCMDTEVTKTTPEQKGDWKPLVFIMTDGIPTDDWQAGLDEFKKRKTAYTVACAAGSGADFEPVETDH